MKSNLIKFNNQAGFTIIEVIMVIALVVILASFALFFSFDFYRTYSYNAEITHLVTALAKARNQSLANINQKEHGMHAEANKYVIFEGAAVPAVYDPNATSNLVIPSGSGTAVSGNTEIIFSRLTGKVRWGNNPGEDCPCTITLTAQSKSKDITINGEGGIEW